jgi:membrane protein YqaA with SNARE-associated domain
MWAYLGVFLAALAVDSVPVFAPPAWTLVLPLVIAFKLNAWVATALCAVGSTIGRYLLSRFMPKVADRYLSPEENANITFLGKKMSGRYWSTFLFVLGYCLTPLSSTALFTAAGMARVNPLPILPAFFIGKFASDALMIQGGKKAYKSFGQLMQGQTSPKAIVFAVLGMILLGAVLFIDWRQLLQNKRLRFQGRIWRSKTDGRRKRSGSRRARSKRRRGGARRGGILRRIRGLAGR